MLFLDRLTLLRTAVHLHSVNFERINCIFISFTHLMSASKEFFKVEQEKTFSPVLVKESPVNKTLHRGNLTGNPRKVRDSAADIYNLIQEWNNHIVAGSEILLKINSLKCDSLKDNKDEPSNCYPDGLQELCNELDKLCLQMSDVVGKMLVTKAEIEGIIKLEKLKDMSDTPMFLTWSADRFGDAWQSITTAYIKELDLKIHIKENVAHSTTAANLMFFVASWVHQPYIDSSVNVSLEALLKETGHR